MPRANRPAAARRQQYARANAKVTQVLLNNFHALQHRGCQPSKLGHALSVALHDAQEKVSVPTTAPPQLQTVPMTLNADAPVFTPKLTTDVHQHFEQLKASVDQISTTMVLLFEAQKQLTSSVRLQLLAITANQSAVQEQMDEDEQIRRLNGSPLARPGENYDMAECSSYPAALNRKDDSGCNAVLGPYLDKHFTEDLADAEMDFLLARFGAESIFSIDEPTTEMAEFIAERRG